MTILPVTHDDVTDVVRAHIALQHVSYAHVADGGHADAVWSTYDERIASLHDAVDAAAADHGVRWGT